MEILDIKLFMIGSTQVTFVWIIKLLLIVVIGFGLAKLFKSKILKIDEKFIEKQKKINIANFGYYAVAIGFITVGFNAIGLDLTSFTVIIGAISVGIGFGLQTLISNFASGIVLAFENSIKIGDLIQLNSGEIGRVKTINMRATIITTADNIDIIVPNSSFITNNIINLTHSNDIRRLVIPFSVSLNSDIDLIKKVIVDAIYNSELIFIRDNEAYPVDVRLTSVEKGILEFNLIIYININAQSSYTHNFLPIVINTLRSNHIDITSPTFNFINSSQKSIK